MTIVSNNQQIIVGHSDVVRIACTKCLLKLTITLNTVYTISSNIHSAIVDYYTNSTAQLTNFLIQDCQIEANSLKFLYSVIAIFSNIQVVIMIKSYLPSGRQNCPVAVPMQLNFLISLSSLSNIHTQ